ncbi:MAG: hypothetical protein AAB595_00645 [Patescibacteria group bacterium]
MKKNVINNSIKKIDNYIHESDPLGLGGASGEYSDVVFNLYRVAKEGMGKITNNQIKNAFKNIFGNLSDTLNVEDLNLIKSFIEETIILEND